MKLLQEIFLYFAKYPAATAIDAFFPKNAGTTEYERLRELAVACSRQLQPHITDYIFGVNEESVKKRISQVKGIYLFVDYGNISTDQELPNNVKKDSFNIAITVAKPTSSGTFDLAQELLISDQLLDIISAIRADMRSDHSDPFVDKLIFPNEITPFFARELSNSYGWTLMFQMEGIDWI